MEFQGWSTVACDPAMEAPLAAEEDRMDLRRGPWTVEEDLVLMNYIHAHGEGRWNSLARCAGLRRTGKSCRLRWLNYLRPDVRRGNITPEEQLLILELHSRWGNRWSKIAQHLPGRTDNEIKNYWRTRVQKHAKQLKCDVNSKQFKDVMRYLWMPRLAERIRAAASAAAAASAEQAAEAPAAKLSPENSSSLDSAGMEYFSPPPVSDAFGACDAGGQGSDGSCGGVTRPSGEVAGYCWSSESAPSSEGCDDLGLPDFDQSMWETLWSVEDIWLQEQC